VVATLVSWHRTGLSPWGCPPALRRFQSRALSRLFSAVGVLYAAFSILSASRFLDKLRHQHAVLTDSALSWTGAFGIALLFGFLAGLAHDLSACR